MVERFDEWLGAELELAGGEGVPGDRADLVGDVAVVAAAVGEMLARIHGLSLSDAPLGDAARGLEGLEELISASGDADTSRLPEPYSRYDAPTLRRFWREGRPDNEPAEVVCHGRPILPAMIFRDGELVALGPSGPISAADRHLDLAIAQQSIQRHLGPEAVFVFYDAYGTDPDLVRLDHYVLASLLLGLV